MPLFEARDSAEGKVASIGKVNPRRGGPLNSTIQLVKRSIARGLGWFIREQVDFNAAAVHAMTETIEALNEVNRGLAVLSARQTKLQAEISSADTHLREATDALSTRIRTVVESIDAASGEIHASYQSKVEDLRADLLLRMESELEAVRTHTRERDSAREREDIRLLRALAEFQNAAAQRWSLLERELRAEIEQRGALAEERGSVLAAEAALRATERVEAAVQRELRLLRQRVGAILERSTEHGDPHKAAEAAALAFAGDRLTVDALAFSDRFRGTEEDVKQKLQVYVPIMQGHSPVADLGCGRGEFLDLLREAGGEGIGIEASPELAAIVAAKGHRSFQGDLFSFLSNQEAESLGGIVCAHVIEHLPPEMLNRLITEAYRVLRPGGLFAIETPNPACLAIFATYFYLDPTHIRPVPSELTRYLLEEAGFTGIEMLGLHPADEVFSSLKPLEEGFRQQFFGYLDYGIISRKS